MERTLEHILNSSTEGGYNVSSVDGDFIRVTSKRNIITKTAITIIERQGYNLQGITSDDYGVRAIFSKKGGD